LLISKRGGVYAEGEKNNKEGEEIDKTQKEEETLFSRRCNREKNRRLLLKEGGKKKEKASARGFDHKIRDPHLGEKAISESGRASSPRQGHCSPALDKEEGE